MERKLHYKMYKAGSKWVFAALDCAVALLLDSEVAA